MVMRRQPFGHVPPLTKPGCGGWHQHVFSKMGHCTMCGKSRAEIEGKG